MTKEVLKQYRSIVAELNEVNDRINSNTVHGTVTASSRMSSTVFLCRVLSQHIYLILYYVNDWSGKKTRLNCLLPVY